MMGYKNQFLVLAIIILGYIGGGYYFDDQIDRLTEQYKEKQSLSLEYYNLKKEYSKEAIKNKIDKIYKFLDNFDIKYKKTYSNALDKTTLLIELDITNLNKTVNYILEMGIPYKGLKIKKKDNYSAIFSVSF